MKTSLTPQPLGIWSSYKNTLAGIPEAKGAFQKLDRYILAGMSEGAKFAQNTLGVKPSTMAKVVSVAGTVGFGANALFHAQNASSTFESGALTVVGGLFFALTGLSVGLNNYSPNQNRENVELSRFRSAMTPVWSALLITDIALMDFGVVGVPLCAYFLSDQVSNYLFDAQRVLDARAAEAKEVAASEE